MNNINYVFTLAKYSQHDKGDWKICLRRSFFAILLTFP